MKISYEGNVKVKTYVDGRIEKYDERGNLIYYKNSLFNVEEWHLYDENDNEIYGCDNRGSSWTSDYDENGNKTNHTRTGGFEWWKEYNDQVKVIHYKSNDGIEWFDDGYYEGRKEVVA